MRTLVTGATGGLGRNLVLRLLREGYRVCATGRNLLIGEALANAGAVFIPGDLTEKAVTSALCKDQDVVFHCAALSSPWGKYRDFYAANVIGTEHIAQACLQHKVRRLIYVSTPSIYFDFTEKHGILEHEPLPAKPANHYVATKLIAEQLLDKAFNKYGLPVVSIRPRGIFGPYDSTLMPRIMRVSRGGRTPLIAGGRALIDVTYVENVVESLLLAAHAPALILGKKYNITNAEPLTLNYLLEKIFTALNLPFRPKNISYTAAAILAGAMELLASLPFVSWEPPLTRYGIGVLSMGQTLDISAARRDLGYVPKISLTEGISRFAQWWQIHHDTN